MKLKIISLCIIIFLTPHFAFSKQGSQNFFRQANKFFKKYVKESQVDYLLIMKERDGLDNLVEMIGNTDLTFKTSEHKKAFYINSYNILLIKNVIANFPVKYPLEEIGFFSKVKHFIAGDSLTLNEIESIKLIAEYKDIRILFVLSSASKGSVPMANFAYKPSKLERQFKKTIKAVVNNYNFIRVMNRSEKILLAENFKRSQRDFNKEDIIYYINKYREEPLPASYTIDFYPANRKLNIIN